MTPRAEEMDEYSDRAIEVARDLFLALDTEVGALGDRRLSFHLDASDVVLSRLDAEQWVKRSVEEGFPEVRDYVERQDDECVIINLAAFEDPDSQYFP